MSGWVECASLVVSVLSEVRLSLEIVVAIVCDGLVSSEPVFSAVSVVVSCEAVWWMISAVEVSGKLASVITSGVVGSSESVAYDKLHIHKCLRLSNKGYYKLSKSYYKFT